MFIQESVVKQKTLRCRNKTFSPNTYHLIYQELYRNNEFKKMFFDEVKYQRDSIFKIMHEQKIVTPHIILQGFKSPNKLSIK